MRNDKGEIKAWRTQKHLEMLASALRLWVGQCTINRWLLFRIVMHVSRVMDVELIGKKNGRRQGTLLHCQRLKWNITECIEDGHEGMTCITLHCEPSLFWLKNLIFCMIKST